MTLLITKLAPQMAFLHPPKNPKIFKIMCHIESLDVYTEY